MEFFLECFQLTGPFSPVLGAVFAEPFPGAVFLASSVPLAPAAGAELPGPLWNARTGFKSSLPDFRDPSKEQLERTEIYQPPYMCACAHIHARI